MGMDICRTQALRSLTALRSWALRPLRLIQHEQAFLSGRGAALDKPLLAGPRSARGCSRCGGNAFAPISVLIGLGVLVILGSSWPSTRALRGQHHLMNQEPPVSLAAPVTKSLVIGIDFGSSESYVSYVDKNGVDIVQNELAKRATSTMVGFTDRMRVLGDAALDRIGSNAKSTCRNFKHLLGRALDSPDLEEEKFWSTSELTPTDDGFCGFKVNYKGEDKDVTATQVTAMYLTKLKEITETWCQGKVVGAVISSPASYSDAQRQALLDAARIASLPVLRIMNEHAATALAYGIYRSKDFDPEKPMTVAFASMGHSIFSVSIVQFVRGKLTMLAERSDKVGGRNMDECLIRTFAEQFKQKNKLDPLSSKKAVLKLENAVSKVKKVLSANMEANIHMEALMEDYNLASAITRSDMEEMCAPMMTRATAVLEAAKEAAGIPMEQIDSVEIVGGGSRVPFFKRLVSEAFGGKPLSTTMNQEESVARGCALEAAILSPLYRVRDFKVEDCSPYAVNIQWTGPASMAPENGDTEMEEQPKSVAIFPCNAKLDLLRSMTFYSSGPFDINAAFADSSPLPANTPKELGTFRVQLEPQSEPKRVNVNFKLLGHGTFAVESAQLVEEEDYVETTKERRELPPEPEEPEAAPDADAAPKASTEEAMVEDAARPKEEGEAKEAGAKDDVDKMEEEEKKQAAEGDKNAPAPAPEKKKAPKPPKYEWVDVKTNRKRTKRTDLKILATGRPGLGADALQKSMDQETAMQAEQREAQELDHKRYELESYIIDLRQKVAEGMEYGAFITGPDRERFTSELTAAEDWLYDHEDATKIQCEEKLAELKATGDAVASRFNEDRLRDQWVNSLANTVASYRATVENPGEKYGHIAPEKLSKISVACDALEKWMSEMKAQQESLAKYEKPVLLTGDMERKISELDRMAQEILKEPKPTPPPTTTTPPPPKQEEEKKEEGPEVMEEDKKENGKMEVEEGTAEAPKEGTPGTDPYMEVDPL